MFHKCNICNLEKPKSSFVKRLNRKKGIQAYCKDCHNVRRKKNYSTKYMRNYDLVKNYGITSEHYNQLSLNQNNSCGICNIHISKINKKHKKYLCVDHCHKTGVIRGLLCDSCNRGIGLLKDNTGILKNAIKYLRK